MSLPFESLDAVGSTGPGAARDLEGSRKVHTLVVSATGTPSTVTAELQGSHDGVNWFNMGSASVNSPAANQGASVSNAEHVARYVRANLTQLSGGSTPTATATIASED